MSKADDRTIARRNADSLMSGGKRGEVARPSPADERRRVEDAKIARLREARLAKEAAEAVANGKRKPAKRLKSRAPDGDG